MEKNTKKPVAGRRQKPPQSRRAAAAMLAAIERGKTLDEAADRLDGLSPRDRSLAYAIVLMVLRRYGEIAALMKAHIARPVPPRPHLARALLQVGLAQLCFMDVPAHAAVNETLQGLGPREKPYRGLINAVLRKVGKQMDAPKDANENQPVPDITNAGVNTPDWLYQVWEQAYGAETAQAIAVCHRNVPPLDLCFKTPEAMQEWCAANADNHNAVPISTTHLRLPQGAVVEALPGYAAGDWWVQDVAAGLPVLALQPLLQARGNPAHVLDLCAAPGGKTLQLAALPETAKVTALDISEKRLTRLTENLTRTGLSAETLCADALVWQPAQNTYDAVLLDAPCSATGTIRRHPDLMLRRKAGDIAKLSELQARLLTRAADWLAPGGLLLYCTCSLDPAEGEEIAASFLQQADSFSALDLHLPATMPSELTASGTANTLRTTPAGLAELGGMDGFFIAIFKKNDIR